MKCRSLWACGNSIRKLWKVTIKAKILSDADNRYSAKLNYSLYSTEIDDGWFATPIEALLAAVKGLTGEDDVGAQNTLTKVENF